MTHGGIVFDVVATESYEQMECGFMGDFVGSWNYTF